MVLNLDDIYIIFDGYKGEDPKDVEDLWHVEDDGGQEDRQKIGDQDPREDLMFRKIINTIVPDLS